VCALNAERTAVEAFDFDLAIIGTPCSAQVSEGASCEPYGVESGTLFPPAAWVEGTPSFLVFRKSKRGVYLLDPQCRHKIVTSFVAENRPPPVRSKAPIRLDGSNPVTTVENKTRCRTPSLAPISKISGSPWDTLAAIETTAMSTVFPKSLSRPTRGSDSGHCLTKSIGQGQHCIQILSDA